MQCVAEENNVNMILLGWSEVMWQVWRDFGVGILDIIYEYVMCVCEEVVGYRYDSSSRN